jgi:hypothetical protein
MIPFYRYNSTLVSFFKNSFSQEEHSQQQYQFVDIPIDSLDIMEYIPVNTRPLKEGCRLERSNSVHNVFAYKVEEERYYLKGECMSSHSIDLIHQFKLILTENVEEWKLSCSCPAGTLGKCKHVLAGLVSVQR